MIGDDKYDFSMFGESPEYDFSAFEDVKKKDVSQVGGENLQISFPSESPSQSLNDKVWDARTKALGGEVPKDNSLRESQEGLLSGAESPTTYYQNEISKLKDTLSNLGINPKPIPKPINELITQHAELNQPLASDPINNVTIKDIENSVVQTPDGKRFNVDPTVISQTTDAEKERYELTKKYFPGLLEAPEPSVKNYLIGYNKAVREAVAGTMRTLENMNLVVSDITGIEPAKESLFREGAESLERSALTRTKMPETVTGAVIKGGVDLTVFLAEMEAVPMKGAGKFFTYMGGKGFADAFGQAEENPWEEGLTGSLLGLKDAAILHSLGYMSGFIGTKVAQKPFAERLAQDQNSWLRKYTEMIGGKSKTITLIPDEQILAQGQAQRSMADVATSLSNAGLYSGYVTGSDYLKTGEVDVNKSIADLAIGYMLPFTSALKSAKNRAYTHFLKAPPQVTAFAKGIKMDVDMARETANKIRESAKNEGDFGNAEVLRMYANTLDAIADVKAVSEKVAENPTEYLNLLKGSGATPEEMAMYKQSVYQAIATHKMPEDVIPDFIRSMNARDEMVEMKKEMTALKADEKFAPLFPFYERTIKDLDAEIKLLDQSVNEALDKDIMNGLNEKIAKGEKLTELEWIYKDRIDPAGVKSVGVTVEGVKENGKLDVTPEGFVIKDDFAKDKKINTAEEADVFKEQTNKKIAELEAKEEKGANDEIQIDVLKDRVKRIDKAKELLSEKVTEKTDEKKNQPEQETKVEEVRAEGKEEIRLSELEKEIDAELKKENKDDDKVLSLQSEYSALENKLRQKEWDSVFMSDNPKKNIEKLVEQDKKDPDSTFIDRKDAGESLSVIDRYSEKESYKLSDSDVLNDFVSALRGNPTTRYSDGLKLKLSVYEASKRGYGADDLIKRAEEVYLRDGYDQKTASEVVAGMLKPILEPKKESNNLKSLKGDEEVTKETDKEENKTEQETKTEEVEPKGKEELIPDDEKLGKVYKTEDGFRLEEDGIINAEIKSKADIENANKEVDRVVAESQSVLVARKNVPEAAKYVFGDKVYNTKEEFLEGIKNEVSGRDVDAMMIQENVKFDKDVKLKEVIDVIDQYANKKAIGQPEANLTSTSELQSKVGEASQRAKRRLNKIDEMMGDKPPAPPVEPTTETVPENEPTPIDRTLNNMKEREKSKKAFEKLHNRTLVDMLREQLVDKTEPSKVRILAQDKSFLKQNGKRVINMMNLEAGASGNALRTFRNTVEKLFGTPLERVSRPFNKEPYLSEHVAKYAWEYAMAKRDVEIFDLKAGERNLEKGASIEDKRAFVDAVEGGKGYEELKTKTGLNDADIARAISAQRALRRTFKEGLDRMLEEGIINQNAYDAFVIDQPFYVPTKYIEFINKIDSNGKLSGVKELQMGSSGARVDDMLTILGDYFQRLEHIIAKNKTYKAIGQYADANPDNTIFKRAELSPEYAQEIETQKAKGEGEYIAPKWKDAPKVEIDGLRLDYTEIDYHDGSPQRLWVYKPIYEELKRQNDPDRIQDAVHLLGLYSGKKILTAAATGYDPGFAIKNPMLDFMYNFLTTKSFSPLLPEAVAQYVARIGGSIKDASTGGGNYPTMMKMGLSQQFLSSQGRFKADNKYGKLGWWSSLGSFIERTLASPGQISEVATRGVVYQMYIDGKLNELRSMGVEPDAKMMKVLQEEATAVARAYLDFSQGGYLTKRIDELIPYFNASTQVTRGALRSASKDPIAFGFKVAQLAAMQGMVTSWNMGGHMDLDDETREGMANAYLNDISSRIKERYYVIMLPYGREDGNGNTVYPFIKIPKDNTVSLFASMTEDALLDGLYNIKPDKNRASEVKNMLGGFVDVTQLPPAISAMVGGQQNKNLYFQEDLWKGYDVGKYRGREWNYGITPERYKVFSELNMSPTRWQYGIQQFTTSQNPIGAIMGRLVDRATYALKGEDRKAYEKDAWAQIKPLVGRFVGMSNPNTKDDKSKGVQTSINAVRQTNNNLVAEIVAETKKEFGMDKPILSVGKDGTVASQPNVNEYLSSVINQIMSDDFLVASRSRNEDVGINDVLLLQERDRLLNKFLTEELKIRGNSNVRNFNKFVWMEPAPRGQMLYNEYSQLPESEKEQYEQDLLNFSKYIDGYFSGKTAETYMMLKGGFSLNP